MFVGWNPTGRRLVSASKDGHLVLWDVLSGEQLAAQDGCCPDGAALVHACLDPRDEAELLVSASQGPAQFVNLRSGQHMPLPVFVLGKFCCLFWCWVSGPSRRHLLLGV